MNISSDPNDNSLVEYWKNKAKESQQRIYININLNTDTSSLEEKITELKEEIQALKGTKNTQITFNYSTEQELNAEDLNKKLKEYINRDF